MKGNKTEGFKALGNRKGADMSELDFQTIKHLETAGRHTDGGGLSLLVKASGRKNWVQRLHHDGKRRDLGLGSFPDVGLSLARDRARENRTRVANGKAPLSGQKFKTATPKPQRASEPTHLFEDIARAAHKHLVDAGRLNNSKNISNWLNRAELYLFPVFAGIEIGNITSGQLLDVLEPIHNTKPETGRQLRLILKRTFNRAKIRGIIKSNPLEGVAEELGRPGKKSVRMKSLPFNQVADALALVDDSSSTLAVKGAVRFMALTAVRGAEVKGATWSEFDLEAGVWEIPAERMKMRQGHTVPLSKQALEVLETMRETYDDEVVFPSVLSSDGMLSENAMTGAFRWCRIQAVPHGMRSSFRTWAAETYGVTYRDAAEQVLAHKTGSAIEQVYNRSEYMAQRRELLDAWATYLDG